MICPKKSPETMPTERQHDCFSINIKRDFPVVKSKNLNCRKLANSFCNVDIGQIIENDDCKQNGQDGQDYHDHLQSNQRWKQAV